MDIEVIILAQGNQTRLGKHMGPKQLLPLPACQRVPILCRTVRQVGALCGVPPTVVARAEVVADVAWRDPDGDGWTSPRYRELPDPGNSSLKGIARYLEIRAHENRRYNRTVVLLGDVVYSWACLRAALALTEPGRCGFVGTANLTEATGEVWGVGWHKECEDAMLLRLHDALLRHPPYEDTYQPGQLRRWITGWQRGALATHVERARRGDADPSYVDIDDYTHDIDLPHDLVLLPELSIAAREDDIARGVTWDRARWGPGFASGPGTTPP